MSLTPAFHYSPVLTGTMQKWIPFKDSTEYIDVYSQPKVGGSSIWDAIIIHLHANCVA